ncbi:MAG: hypothetical protein JW892_16250 [Anaerolineae bacterium]|nr:hypothetical protein [Anaerolineae bacterium]
MTIVRDLCALIERHRPLPEHDSAVRPRELCTFADAEFLDRSSEEAKASLAVPDLEKRLLALGVLYRLGEYKPIRDFFGDDPDRLGNRGKLLLVLAYLRLFDGKHTSLSRFVLPIVKDLLSTEPSEFGTLYDWLLDYVQERPMSPRFYEKSIGCERSLT